MRSSKLIIIYFIIIGSSFSCLSSQDDINRTVKIKPSDTLLINGVFSTRFDIEMTKVSNVSLYFVNDSIKLTALVTQGPVVIFFISEYACLTCISEQLDFIRDYYDNHDKLPIYIIQTAFNQRSGFALMIEKQLDFPFFQTKNEDIGFDRIKHPGPLFFILDDDLLCKFSYEPVIHSSILTCQYLSTVAEKFY